MAAPSAHADPNLSRLEVALVRFVEEQGGEPGWFFVSRMKWLRPEAPSGFLVPDLMFYPSASASRFAEALTGECDTIPADVVPALIIEGVEEPTLQTDFYLKPEWYRDAGVTEYCVYDRTEAVLRPYFQGWRLRRGEYSPMRMATRAAELFSVLGFSLSLLFHDPVLQRCGPAELEEELSELEWLLDKARERVGNEQHTLAALTARHGQLMQMLKVAPDE